MKAKFPLVATVVGALVIGGATTGTTLALWRDQTAVAQSSVMSGTIKLDVDGSTSATFNAVNNLGLNSGSTAGAAQPFTATLKNSGTGKHLRMQVHLDAISANADLTAGLEVAVSTVDSAEDCPTTPTTSYTALSAWTTAALTPSMAPDATRKLCGHVRVKGGATNIAGKSGTLTFNFRGQQVRP